MRLGPVEILILTFPGERVPPPVADAIAAVVAHADVTLLDLLVVARTQDGSIRITELDDADTNLADLPVQRLPLASSDDLDLIVEGIEPGSCAVVVVYEHTWARRVAAAVTDAGGEVALLARVPHDVAEAALNAVTVTAE